MTFVFEGPGSGVAIDKERGITFRPTHKFLDSATFFSYEIVGPDWQFEFTVSLMERPITFISRGTEVTSRLVVGAYITERDLPTSINSFSTDEIKTILKNGAFEFFTRGGYWLNYVPDFKIDFVPTLREAEAIRVEIESGKRNN
jgi:hypothetical protein